MQKILFAILGVAVLLVIGKVMFFSVPSAEKIAQLQSYYNQVGGYKLGEAVAKQFSAKKVLVILPEDMTSPDGKSTEDFLIGLKEVSATAGFTIVEASLKPRLSNQKPVDGEPVAVARRQGSEWDSILAKDGKDCTVLIALTSLPTNDSGEFTPPAGIEKFKLVMIGDPGAAKGQVDMDLLLNPNSGNSLPTTKDREKVFAAIWQIQTK